MPRELPAAPPPILLRAVGREERRQVAPHHQPCLGHFAPPETLDRLPPAVISANIALSQQRLVQPFVDVLPQLHIVPAHAAAERDLSVVRAQVHLLELFVFFGICIFVFLNLLVRSVRLRLRGELLSTLLVAVAAPITATVTNSCH